MDGVNLSFWVTYRHERQTIVAALRTFDMHVDHEVYDVFAANRDDLSCATFWHCMTLLGGREEFPGLRHAIYLSGCHQSSRMMVLSEALLLYLILMDQNPHMSRDHFLRSFD